MSDIDLVLDIIGGETQQYFFGVLRSGGLLLATASPPDEALANAHHVAATFVLHSSDAGRRRKVVDSVDAGARILVDRVVALATLSKAFAYQAAGRARGKIILTM